MLAIFFVGHLDAWSVTDSSLERGLKRLSSGLASEMGRIVHAMRPYRTVFALHVWGGWTMGAFKNKPISR